MVNYHGVTGSYSEPGNKAKNLSAGYDFFSFVQGEEEAKQLEELKRQEEEFKKKEDELAKKERVRPEGKMKG